MTNGKYTFSVYLLIISMIAPLCPAAEVEVGPATPPEVRINEDEIFIVAFNLLHSTDAGKTQTSITERTVPMLSYKADRPTPHCDNHDMFIDRVWIAIEN